MKQFIYRINGQEYVVAVNKMDNSLAEVAVNGTAYKVELVNSEEEVTLVSRPATKAPTTAAATSTPKAAPAAPKASAAGAKAINSPLPGIIVSINVNVGDQVKKGQTVAVLEAMKMENTIQATADGTVASIEVNAGDSILEGVAILTIA